MKRIYLRWPRLGLAASLCLLLGAGCARQSSPTDPHGQASAESGHDHHHSSTNRTAQITAWSDRYEIFAEHPLAIAGQPAVFVTHVTDLRSLEPRSAGPISYRMRLGQEPPIEQAQNTPGTPGIYKPTLTFPKAGAWEVSVVIPEAGAEAAVALPPVVVYANEHDASHAPEPAEAEGITFLKEQQWRMQIKTDPVAKRSLVERVPLLGQIRPKPGFQATVIAPLSGQLALPADGAWPAPGTRVTQGDLLALLRPRLSESSERFLQINTALDEADAAVRRSEAAHARVLQLVSEKIESRQELEEAEAALASARARQSAVRALQSTYAAGAAGSGAAGAMELRAPITGFVASASGGPGEFAAEDQALFTILNPSQVWLEARVPESAAGRISAPADAICELLDGSGRMFPIREGTGRLVSAGLVVDSATRTVPLLYELDNAEGLLMAGQTVRLHAAVASAPQALVIPESALAEEGGIFAAFVQVSGEKFEKRELRLGLRDGEWVQVLSGLREGERVVTKGAYAVRLASASAVIPAHGHEH